MAVAGLSLNQRRRPRRLGRVLVHGVLLAGLFGVIGAVQLLVLLVLGRFPSEEERWVLAVSMVAAAVTALAYQPARARLEAVAGRLRPVEQAGPDEMLRTLGTRLSRAIPLDELLQELVESLRWGLGLHVAEIWTYSAGLLERATSDPDQGPASVALAPGEESVIARGGVRGPAWLAVWLPGLLDQRAGGPLVMSPMANAGELLGAVVAERPPAGPPLAAADERVLAELARQLGLALRNVHLDSQLSASLHEVRRQADELRASRARVVEAADAERRRIERDLHDGAQQQLVALIVNLRLARELARSDPTQARTVLDELSGDLQAAVEDLRELAHGIYPPLLADRGLVEALAAVTARPAIRTRLEAAAVGRHPPQIEATVYFCCLEALQNAAKHAGPGASATVRVWEEAGGLLFEVTDDGAGFDPARATPGAGLTNMTDRLGAIGGSLRIASSPGSGARVAGTIPVGV